MGKKTEKGSGAPRSTRAASSSHPDSPARPTPRRLPAPRVFLEPFPVSPTAKRNAKIRATLASWLSDCHHLQVNSATSTANLIPSLRILPRFSTVPRVKSSPRLGL